MLDHKSRLFSILLTAGLVAFNLVALNYLLSGWSTARLDMTQDRLFSISPATKRILTTLDEDLTIYAYFSKRTHPKLAPLVPEILDLLDEYRAVSAGRVTVEVIEPGEDEAVMQEAADRFGVQSRPFQLVSKYESGIVNAYFSLVVQYANQYERYGVEDLIVVEPLPDNDIDVRLRNLEYDLTRAIKKVVFGFRSSNELFERVTEPVRFTAIMSPPGPGGLPDIFSEVPEAVRKAAQELQELGGDKFVYEELDPTGNEALQQELFQRYGLRAMTLSFLSTDSFFLYGLLEVGGRLEQLILTEESLTAASLRESIESSLKRHTPGFLTTVGIAAPEPIQIPPQMQMQYGMSQPPPEFEDVQRFLGQDYEVTKVTLDDERGVPPEVDVLLVLKPKNLSEFAVYNLDQYLMRGGRIVLCAGNYEADFTMNGLSVNPLETGLGEWLAHNGVSIGETLVLDDRNQPLPIPEVRSTALGNLRTWTMAPYPYLVQVRDEGFLNRDITASLDSVGIYWGSPLSVEQDVEDLEVIPILRSSRDSWLSSDLSAVGFVDYEVPAEGTEPQLLAVALNGRFKSFFQDKVIPTRDGAAGDDLAAGADESGESPLNATVALERSPETRLVVVANAEFVSDFVARMIGQLDGGFFVENLRFVQNLIDWTSLDNDMISIRSRGALSRRLTKIDKRREVALEAMNYILPPVLLLGLATYRYRRRKNAVPLLDETAGRNPANRPSRGEA